MATGRDVLRFARRWERKHPGASVFQLRVALYQHFLGESPTDVLSRDPVVWLSGLSVFVVVLYPVIWLWELVFRPNREEMVGRIEAVLRMIEEERTVNGPRS